MISMEDARARVARGAAHLDTVKPGWHERIDVGTLTLWDACGCIVGQLCSGAYHPRSLGLQPDDPAINLHVEDWYDVQVLRGSMSKIVAYQPLQDAWIEAIAARLHPDHTPVAPSEAVSA